MKLQRRSSPPRSERAPIQEVFQVDREGDWKMSRKKEELRSCEER
jgi:hypothetical protein